MTFPKGKPYVLVLYQVTVLVLGGNTEGVVAEATKIDGVSKVLFANNAVRSYSS